MAGPVAFISHSSEDAAAARTIADILRERGVDPWLDREQIRPGDSIPGRIEEGLSNCDVILVLISESFVRSRWSRAEYEPLLSAEIESGRTMVIPVLLDDAKIPRLLSAKKYADLREGLDGEAMEELVATILDRHSTAVIERLRPGEEDPEAARYGSTLLSMIIAKVLRDYPVAAISQERILHGKSILDLYRTVEMLITNYEDLCDEIIDLLVEADVTDKHYVSAYHVPGQRIRRTNRKLLDIANDMRDIARSLDDIVDADSPLHRRLTEVLELCTQISAIEDILLIGLGAPPELPERPIDGGWYVGEARFPVEDQLSEVTVADLEQLLRELNTYKAQLRRAVAAARAGS